jgi:hypothetical protein
LWDFQSRFWHVLLQQRDAGMAQPVQTRVPVLMQEEAEQVAVEDIVAGNEEDLGIGNNPH